MKNRKSGRPRVVVVGAGAMGSIFGAALDTVAEVVLLDIWAEHVAAIRRDGLIVEYAGGRTRTIRLAAETDPAAVAGGADLALIFTKSSATREAAETARRLLGADGSALTLQNGLGNADRVSEVLGPDRTLAGITAHGGTVLGPGRVRHAGEGETHIAGAGPGARPGPVADLLTRAGIVASVADDPDALIWGKLVVNAGINALAALLRVPNGALAEVPACDALMASAVAEAVAVAREKGVALPYDDPLNHVRAVCRRTAENRASMLQDTAAGRTTEVDVINGAIVREGAKLGISTPVNRMLTDLIHALEATTRRRLV